MKNIIRTIVKKTSYMDLPATLTTHHLDNDPFGLRIAVLHFDDAATAEIRMIKGDGRKDAGFEVKIVLDQLPVGCVDATVQAWLECQ